MEGARHRQIVIELRADADQRVRRRARTEPEHQCQPSVPERDHVRNLDPLKVLIVRALPATFFFLPVLGALRARYVAGREMAADRRAVQECGRKPLVSALLKVVRGPAWSELEVAAAIGGPELLDLRVAQLESGREPRLAAFNPMGVGLSALGAFVFTGAFIASVVNFGGPSAVSQATGTGMSLGEVLGGAMCIVRVDGRCQTAAQRGRGDHANRE
ncbi:MAG TPA: M56 family metallopeptidase [Solirubrobacteraceae bacterium]|nr:M56 family metallopeptidase [Solirubrobacteraceae bacterium]